MSSSSNTFGTFLQTFSNLEKQGDWGGVPKPAVKTDVEALVRLVQDIAKKGDNSSLKDLIAASTSSKEQLLSTVLTAKDQGLLEIQDNQGEAVASLTNFGKIFSVP